MILGLRQARYDYINDIIGDARSNPKPFWKVIAAQRKDNQSMPPLQTQQDLLAESDFDMARILNQQLCQNFSSEDTESGHVLKAKVCQNAQHPSKSGVLKLLAALKPPKAAGPNGLHPTVLKEVAPVTTLTLAFIFQKSQDSSSVPEDWHVAKVCPLFKKGDRSITTNYRERNPSQRKGGNLRS